MAIISLYLIELEQLVLSAKHL